MEIDGNRTLRMYYVRRNNADSIDSTFELSFAELRTENICESITASASLSLSLCLFLERHKSRDFAPSPTAKSMAHVPHAQIHITVYHGKT